MVDGRCGSIGSIPTQSPPKDPAPESLGKELMLHLGGFNPSSTFLIVVGHVIDPGTHGITSHKPGITRLQQLGSVSRSWIEPAIVAVWLKNDGHAVVHGGGRGIRCRGQDGTGSYPAAAGVLPAVPKSCEREQLPVINLEAVRLLAFPCPLPLVEAVCGNEAPAELQRFGEGGLGTCCL